MAQTYFPFDSGQGGSVTEAQWGEMAQLWLSTGVIKGQLNQLNVYADSTGLQVKADTGKAWIQGYYYKNDTLLVLPIANADPANPRIDRVILRLDWTMNTIQLAVLQGTPAASPSAPAVTQNTGKWEISLAQVYVGANVSTIAAGNITDERPFAWTTVGGQHSVAIGVSGQTLTANADTQMTLIPQGNNYPLDSGWSTSNWTCPAAGVYEINTNIMVNAVAGSLSMTKLYVNGINDQFLDSIYTSTAQLIGAGSSTIKTLKAGDVLKFYVNNSASGATIAGNYSRINIKRIG